MKKLFLASQGLSALPKFISIDPKKTKMAFITTAANPAINNDFIERDRKVLEDFGYKLEEIDIEGKTKNNLSNILKDFPVIFVAGGNTFYLLEKVRETGFDEIIKDLVNSGTIYVGASAGSVLVGPNIKPVSHLDNPKVAPNLKSFEGLGLVDFIVLPHWGDPKYQSTYDKVEKDCKKMNLKTIMLRDDQAVIVEGSDYKVIRSS